VSQRFNALKEELLRAGIAPRHVRCYVAELRDHFDDLVREETAKGLTRNVAEDAARARIGGDDALADVMLSRPELRSVVARFPWAVFGLGPVLMLVLVVSAAILIEGGIAFLHPAIPRWSVDWARFSFDAVNWLVMYAAPLAIAAVVSVVGINQRVTTGWVVFGLIIISVVGGFHEVGVKWSYVPMHPSELDESFALAPPFPRAMIVSGLFRAAINLTLAGVTYLLWIRRESSAATE
jgi:hypothetical protein